MTEDKPVPLPEKIDPADLAPHNARMGRMFRAQAASLEAEKLARERCEAAISVLTASDAELRKKYALREGDDWNPETGVITRAKANE